MDDKELIETQSEKLSQLLQERDYLVELVKSAQQELLMQNSRLLELTTKFNILQKHFESKQNADPVSV